ncbi:glycosyltransferase [Streptomyces sp. ISL-12]|uniref:glycosyltransferase family 2 protein n=1 Tax=Streptomyces sp. ISL-12 TaxID=2819177 RepID=UPI0020357457|nr:glycosyltransferase [Streptomyces sp. ISL-12]
MTRRRRLTACLALLLTAACSTGPARTDGPAASGPAGSGSPPPARAPSATAPPGTSAAPSATGSPSAATGSPSSPVPPPATSAAPVEAAFPDARSTGPRVRLTPKSTGDLSVRTDGAVIKGQDITGSLDIYADDVTIVDSRITSANWWGVNLRPGHHGLRILHSTITAVPGEGPDNGGVNYAVSNMGTSSVEVGWCDISVFGNALSMGQGHIHDSYVHDLVAFRNNGGEWQHLDAVISGGGNDGELVIRHNTLLNPAPVDRGASAAVGLRRHRPGLRHGDRRQPPGGRGVRPVRGRRGCHRHQGHRQRLLDPLPPEQRLLRTGHRLERGRRGQRLAREPVLRRYPGRPRAGRLRKRIMRRIVRAPWELLKHAFGWIVLFELRNKVLLLPSALRLRRLENAETRRLAAALAPPPAALVATVIATHRRPEQLRAAVRSALAQTARDQVVVVVDDGAGLPELPDDPRLFAVSLSRNTGVAGVVRNVGIRLTRSRYVAFLDDDNLWEPDHLERALAVLEAPGGPDGVYTALRRVLPDGTERDVLSVPFDRRRAARESFLDTNAFVARRDGSLHFSRLRRTPRVLPREDWELIRRYGRGHRVRHVPHPTVRYLVNPGSFYTTWSG